MTSPVPTNQTVTPLPDLDSTDWYGWATDLDTWTRAVASGAATGVGLSPNVVTANYTLAATDGQCLVAVNAAGAVTVTVPKNSTVNFPQGTVIRVVAASTGQVTIAGATGVTLRTPTGRDVTTRAQFSMVELRQAAIDTWYLEGDLTRTDVDAASQAYTDAAVDFTLKIQEYDGSAWPNRKDTSGTNIRIGWVGPYPGPASGGTASGGTPKYAPGDMLFLS